MTYKSHMVAFGTEFTMIMDFERIFTFLDNVVENTMGNK
jgi:hypothetical protein